MDSTNNINNNKYNHHSAWFGKYRSMSSFF